MQPCRETRSSICTPSQHQGLYHARNLLACTGNSSATANKWPLRYAYKVSSNQVRSTPKSPLTRSGLALASRCVLISYVLNCVRLFEETLDPCAVAMEGLPRFCGGTDRPAFWRSLQWTLQRWMPPPQIKACVFCVEAPPRVEFCGLTTENRAGFLVDGGRNGAGLSRVGLHPDCGFRDPCASCWTRVPNPSKGS